MRIVSTYEFRDKLASLLGEVVKNETEMVVSKFGKPLVVVVPYVKKKKKHWSEFYGFLGSDGETGEEFVDRIRRSKKEIEYAKKLRNRTI